MEGDHPARSREPELRTHEGYEWLYVLSGQMRLILGEHDITMRPGEVAEFDTRLPHWFGPADDRPVEILSVHGATASACTSVPRLAEDPIPPSRATADRRAAVAGALGYADTRGRALRARPVVTFADRLRAKTPPRI